MLDTAILVWRVVSSLGVGGMVAAVLVLLNVLMLVAFLVRSIWDAVSRPEPQVLPNEARDAGHLEPWRKRMKSYLDELNLVSNSIRRDAVEYYKESSQWARLGVQYALIVNAGAMAALPYLLNGATGNHDHMVATLVAKSAAGWFASGIIFAADCCLFTYVNYQAHGARQLLEQAVETNILKQRHFAIDELLHQIPKLQTQINVCTQFITWTVFLGVVFGVCAWIAFMWGAIKLVVSVA